MEKFEDKMYKTKGTVLKKIQFGPHVQFFGSFDNFVVKL